MKLSPSEERRSRRTRRSDAVLWRPLGCTTFQVACTLEDSDDGLAFAWRGDLLPSANDLIELHRNTPSVGPPQRAVVRRVALAHDNLCVIGAEVMRTRPFPPATSSAYIEPSSAAEQVQAVLNLAA